MNISKFYDYIDKSKNGYYAPNPKNAEILTVLLSNQVTSYNVWKNSGQKIFMLSDSLVEAFQNTDIPLDCYPSDFKYPFGSFMILSKIPLFHTLHGESDIQRDVHIMLYQSKEAVLKAGVNKFLDEDKTIISAPKWDHNITGFFDCDIMMESMNMFMTNNQMVHYETPPPYLQMHLDKNDIQNMVNIFFNTLMYLNDLSRNKQETEKKENISFFKKHSSIPYRQEYIYLKPPKSYQSLNKNDKSRILECRFIVRGHWRNQSCGEQHKDRKYIWIKPFYKGPELAPLVNKPYMIT